MNYWFTSDTHFCHTNILKYCNRPFSSIKEMDEAIITNWNQLVKPGDIVYHLGDFAFAKTTQEVEKIIKSLNGQITLIRGNHDHEPVYKAKGFTKVTNKNQSLMVKVKNEEIYLSHFPNLTWDKSHHGVRHLFGHCHGNNPGLCLSLSVNTAQALEKLLPKDILQDIINEIKSPTLPINAKDVGMDCNNYKPFNYDELPALIKKESSRE